MLDNDRYSSFWMLFASSDHVMITKLFRLTYFVAQAFRVFPPAEPEPDVSDVAHPTRH